MMQFRGTRATALGAPLALAIVLLASGCGAPPDKPLPPAQPEAVKALEVLRPTGRFAVGLKAVTLPSTQPLWLFYPTDDQASARTPDLVDLPPSYQTALTRRFGAPAAAALLTARGNASWNAMPSKGRFPVLVFTPGAGMGARDYRLLLEEITSQGYVVAALNPLGSPPVSEARYSEAADELSRATAAVRDMASTAPWADVIDTGRVGLIGHSIGGAAAVLALSRTPSALAAVNLDGDFSAAANAPAPSRPVLYIAGLTDGERQASRDRRGALWKTVSNGNAQAIALQIPTLRHFDFADAALLPPSLMSDNRRRNRFGAIGGPRAHVVTSRLLTAFFEQALSKAPETLDAALAATPEARRTDSF